MRFINKNQRVEQQKQMRYQDNIKSNLNFLQEQIKMRKEQERFEKDAEKKQADLMNKKALDELEKEAKRNEDLRRKRIQHKDDLRNQG